MNDNDSALLELALAEMMGKRKQRTTLRGLEGAYKGAAIAAAAGTAPLAVPLIAALPPDWALAIGMALPSSGASLALVNPTVARGVDRALDAVTKIFRF